jgi:hypothetical protein
VLEEAVAGVAGVAGVALGTVLISVFGSTLVLFAGVLVSAESSESSSESSSLQATSSSAEAAICLLVSCC